MLPTCPFPLTMTLEVFYSKKFVRQESKGQFNEREDLGMEEIELHSSRGGLEFQLSARFQFGEGLVQLREIVVLENRAFVSTVYLCGE